MRLAVSPLSLNFITLGRCVNPNSCDCVKLRGRLDPAILERSLGLLALRHFRLGSVLRRRGLRYWSERVENPRIPVEWRTIPGDIPAPLTDRFLDPVWSKAFDLAAEPPARVIVTEARDATLLQVITTHVHSDAKAGYVLIEDLLECYRCLAEGRDWLWGGTVSVPPPFRKVLRAGDGWSGRAGIWARLCLRLVAESLLPVQSLRLPRRPKGRTGLVQRCPEAGFLADARRRAREKGTTLHVLFSLALYRLVEGRNRAGKLPIKFTDSFSVRRMAGPEAERAYDNMIVPFFPMFRPGLRDAEFISGYQARLDRIKRGGVQIELRRQLLYGFLSHFVPARLGVGMIGAGVVKSNLILTNPGVLPSLESPGGIQVEDYFSFSQLWPPYRFMISITTFRDRLRFLAFYDRGVMGEAEAEGLLDGFLAHLQGLVDGAAEASGATRAFETAGRR